MKNCISNILNLQGYIIYKVKVKAKEILVWVGRPKKESKCPHCGAITRSIHSRRKKERKVFHGSCMGRKVLILIKPRRFRCICGRTHTESYPGIGRWRRQSESGIKMILSMLSKESFNAVSKRTGMSYWTLRKIIERVKSRSWRWLVRNSRDGYLYLGIDEHSFRGQNLVITVTEVKQKELIMILSDDRKRTLEEFLEGIPSFAKERIREVCIDMKAGWLEAIKEKLPSAKVVLDPFHLIEDANRRVDEARRIEQEGMREKIAKKIFLVGRERVKDKERLEELLRRYPTVREFYEIKEKLREMYRLEKREEAEKKLSFIIALTEESEEVEINLWGKTLRRWRQYILNHFENGTSNGYTEGVHTKIKLLKRISYGFRNVEVYVKKMLLGFLPPFLLYYLHTF